MADSLVSIVTGASRGIGRAIAIRLGQLHHVVLVNYVRNADAAGEVVKAIESAGGKALAVQGHVGRADDREALVQTAVDRYGRLDVLVNNAGITSPGRRDLLEATEASWDEVFDTNLKGPFFLSQRAAQTMISLRAAGQITEGKIINVSSISAYAVSTDRADYCLTKAAQEMMTWLFATRLADERIQVIDICPGIIASDMTAPVREKYDRLIDEGLSPIRRWGQPEDVAEAVAAIVQNRFPFTTGQRLHIDGGFHIRRL